MPKNTARVAHDVAGRTSVMQAASATLTGEMNVVSDIVDKNAVSAHQMQTTTNSVLAAIGPIADTALTQAETADANTHSEPAVVSEPYRRRKRTSPTGRGIDETDKPRRPKHLRFRGRRWPRQRELDRASSSKKDPAGAKSF
jgi:hypothetical protein